MTINWKFWTWEQQRSELQTLADFHDQVTECTEELSELRLREETLMAERDRLAEQCEKQEAEFQQLYHRTPAIVTNQQQIRANLERLMTLAGLRPEEPLWKVFLSYADEHTRNEAQTALLPNLGDAERQYNAGRAASAADFAMALRDLRLQAEHEARKKVRSEGKQP